MGQITKEDSIKTTTSLINTLKEQIKNLQEHPEDNFFGNPKDTIKGWEKAIKEHQQNLTHLQSLPDKEVVAQY